MLAGSPSGLALCTSSTLTVAAGGALVQALPCSVGGGSRGEGWRWKERECRMREERGVEREREEGGRGMEKSKEQMERRVEIQNL